MLQAATPSHGVHPAGFFEHAMLRWFVERHHSQAWARFRGHLSSQPLAVWFQAQQSCVPDESLKERPSSFPRCMVLSFAPFPPPFREGSGFRDSVLLGSGFFLALLAFLLALEVRPRDAETLDGDLPRFGFCGLAEDAAGDFDSTTEPMPASDSCGTLRI